MAVERQRREAEQQHRVRADAAAPRDVLRGRLAARSLVPRPRRHLLAEHGAPLLLDGEDVAREDALGDGREHQRAGAAVLHRDVGQLGLPANRLPDAQRPVEPEPLAREHAARQGHGRDHSGVPRAAVRPERVAGKAWQEVEALPARGQRVPRLQLGLAAPEGQAQEVSRRGGDDIHRGLPPPDMSLQIVEPGGGGHAGTGGRRRCQSVARW